MNPGNTTHTHSVTLSKLKFDNNTESLVFSNQIWNSENIINEMVAEEEYNNNRDYQVYNNVENNLVQ